jgi:hypothetical protein
MSAPITISDTPTAACQVNGSRSHSVASTIVNGRLSLSIGATHDAGAIWSARKYASHDTPVASPDSVRNSRLRPDSVGTARC